MNGLSSFTATHIIGLTVEAENKLIIDTITAAASERKYMCELKELTAECEATLTDNGFKIKRVEMIGGSKITVKWA